VAQPTVAPIDQPLDVHIDFATQIAFDQMVAVDVVAQPGHFCFIQIFDTRRFSVDLLAARIFWPGGLADPMGVGERDDEPVCRVGYQHQKYVP
jgi:hypothetical protein